jgi:hypothetical protein
MLADIFQQSAKRVTEADANARMETINNDATAPRADQNDTIITKVAQSSNTPTFEPNNTNPNPSPTKS